MQRKQQQPSRAKPRQRRRAQPVPRPRPQLPQRAAGIEPKAHLSNCTLGYSKSLADPYTQHGFGIPNTPAVPTWKTFVFAKGNLQTSSTTGFGYIIMRPEFASANDTTFLIHSLSTFPNSSMDNSGVGTNAVASNSPYIASQFGGGDQDARFRVVSAGVRIRYIGTELNRGGTLYSVQHPSHSALSGVPGATAQELAALNVTKINSVSREWTSVVYCPVYPSDFDYKIAATTQYFMGHAIEAPDPTTSISFEYEAYVNLEFVGAIVRGMSRSPSDSTGMSAVTSAMQGSSLVHRGDSKNASNNFISQVEKALIAESSKVLHTGLDWAWGAVKDGAVRAASSLLAL